MDSTEFEFVTLMVVLEAEVESIVDDDDDDERKAIQCFLVFIPLYLCMLPKKRENA
jgi:hypothetical protein